MRLYPAVHWGTARALHVHVGDHINNIKKGLKTHSVSRHFNHSDPKHLKFWGLENVSRHWQGGNYICQLSRRESFWICETKVMMPAGLNVEFDLNCFISDSFFL